MQHKRRYVLLAVAIGAMVAGALPGVAQETRTRTLTFDPSNEDWVEVPPPLPGTVEAELYDIRLQLKREEYRSAKRSVDRFIKEHGETHALYPDALIARAKALIGLREFYKAHVVLTTFLNEFAGVALTSEALRLEFVIAETFLAGTKRKVWGVPLLSGEELALEILDSLSSDYPESRFAELAIKTKADRMFADGDFVLAEMEYARLLQEFPRSRYHQFSLRRSADSALAAFGGVEYDEAALIEADERFEEYRLRYAADADGEGVELILNDVREKRAEKEFSIGSYYERTGHLTSAVYYFRLIVRDWPETVAAVKAGARLELLGASRVAVERGAG